MNARTPRVQYVFLDVVGFTKDRSVEAQTDVVSGMNDIVTDATARVVSDGVSTIFIPTGDGIAIAIIDDLEIDTHLRLAVEILRRVAEWNQATMDAMRRFDLRVGVNENRDNLLLDINKRENVSGAGIALAQRIMNLADAGQILLGQAVYEILHLRERYMKGFRAYSAKIKHGESIRLYQFVPGNEAGINVEEPSSLVSRTKPGPEPKLDKFAAYYMAHALANRDFLCSKKEFPGRDYVAVILLKWLAEDSEERSRTADHNAFDPETWGADRGATFAEQFEHYAEIEFAVLSDYAQQIQENLLKPFDCYFIGESLYETGMVFRSVFVNEVGREALVSSYPEITSDFGLVKPKPPS